jgi:hypothetical protein
MHPVPHLLHTLHCQPGPHRMSHHCQPRSSLQVTRIMLGPNVQTLPQGREELYFGIELPEKFYRGFGRRQSGGVADVGCREKSVRRGQDGVQVVEEW